MATTLTEIAPDLFRIATYVPEAGLQFNQFLIRDDEPLLFETGYRSMFEVVREAVARVVDPSKIRWIGFSHFEGDECGALNEWLQTAAQAQAVCSLVGAVTSVEDFAIRPPRAMQHDEVLATGRYRFRFRQTPHVPHCWDAGLLFEEVHRTLLASDLFYHDGDVEPIIQGDIVGRTQRALGEYTSGPLAVPIPYTQDTERILHGLADLKPRTIATHHGSAFVGDGERALRDLVLAIKDVGRWVEIPGPTVQSPEDLKGAPDALPSDAIDLGNARDAEGGQR
jgi:flavorubredoxin